MTCLIILGIELASITLQMYLPQDKSDRITVLLEDWSQNHWCRHKDLKSLIGHLQHACKVVPQGHSFLRRMINLLCAFPRDDHPICLNQEFFLGQLLIRQLLCGGHSAVWHFKSPNHVLGSLSVPVGSSSLLLFHCLSSNREVQPNR